MDMEKLTRNTQLALQQAQQLAREGQHAEIDAEHLLAALLQDAQGLVPRLLQKMEVDTTSLRNETHEMLDKRPRMEGRAAEESQIYASVRLQRVLDRAEKEVKKLKDQYMSVEHLLLSLASEPTDTPVGKL